MKTSPSAPAAPPRPRAFRTARRWLPARRSAIPEPASTSPSASSPRSFSGRKADGVSGCWRPCRTACSTCAESSCAINSASPAARSRSIPRPATASTTATPRRAPANDSGGGQPGRILRCKGWRRDPNAYTYFVTQEAVWGNICEVIGKPDWKHDPDYATAAARLPRLDAVFAAVEAWTRTKTKFEVMEICNPLHIPVGPILSMKELAEAPSPAADRHGGGGGSSRTGQLSDRGVSDQTVRLRCGGNARAPARRAHRGKSCARCSAARRTRWPPSRNRAPCETQSVITSRQFEVAP